MSSSSDKIVWNEVYLMGIEKIDEEHRVFVDTINKANYLLTQECSIKNLQGITKDLSDYANFHFETEEGLMQTYKYSSHAPEDFKKHIEEHREFSAKIESLRDEINKGQCIDRSEIINFACQWLVDHIHNTDNKLADFLKKTMDEVKK